MHVFFCASVFLEYMNYRLSEDILGRVCHSVIKHKQEWPLVSTYVLNRLTTIPEKIVILQTLGKVHIVEF